MNMKIGINLKGINFHIEGDTIVFDTERTLEGCDKVQVFNIITVEGNEKHFDNCNIIDCGKIEIKKDGVILLNDNN